MPGSIVCPNFDARLTAPEAVLGKKVKCKKCDERFVAKRSPVNDEPPRKATKARQPAGADDAEVEPRPKGTKKGSNKKKCNAVNYFESLKFE